MKKTKLSELSTLDRKLVQTAIAIRHKAYAPFSHYSAAPRWWT
jgi:hypothetical protein